MRASLAGGFLTVAMLTSHSGWATVFQDYQLIDSFTGTSPRAITGADFDGDGNGDTAVTLHDDGSGTHQIAVLLGDGSGDFATATTYATGNAPYSIDSAILSAGGVGLVTANRDSDTISVFLNDGDGTFDDNQATYATGTEPVYVLAAQLDGVNNTDLVAVNNGSNSISVFLNSGTGTFPAKTDYTTNLSSPVAVAAADLDGMNGIDLAVINQGDNSISVFLNNGSGGFGFDGSYGTGATPSAIAAGDLDGDNFPDLVVSNSAGDTISVLINQLDGSFASGVSYNTESTPHSVVLADLDLDTDLDIAVTNNASDTVSVFENQSVADGVFNTRRDFSSVQGPSGLAARDLDGDSYAELLVTNLLNGNITYLQNLSPVTPDPFSFASVVDATTATNYTSNSATVTGLIAPAPISINANQRTDASGAIAYDAAYSINGGAFTSDPGTITNGSTVQVRVLSSTNQGDTVTKTLTIGGLDVTFSVTTAGDAVPNAFSISPRVDAEPGAAVISSPVTITGLGAPATIIISGGEYRINGGAFTSAAGNVNNNDSLEIRLTASSSFGAQRQALVSVGGIQATFIVITRDNATSSAGGGSGAVSAWGILTFICMGWFGRQGRRHPGVKQA